MHTNIFLKLGLISSMIEITNLNQSEPYKLFYQKYCLAKKNKQPSIEAISISSYNSEKKIVSSRFVNLKYINDTKWIFFSNYNSAKSADFNSHNQISSLIYWEKINLQIRMEAIIKKISSKQSDEHFSKRTKEKNALAICSDQSKNLISYEDLRNDFKNTLSNSNVYKRPEYWGGFSFEPYSFEFWEGEKNRLNRRTLYRQVNRKWNKSFLQP